MGRQPVAYLALFVALGGTGAYAADKIGSGDIANNAVRSKHIKRNQVKGGDVKETTLTGLKCPGGTLYHEAACIETSRRTAAVWNTANDACLNAGRRLPTLAELQTFRQRSGQDMGSAREWTSHRWDDVTEGPTTTSYAWTTNDTGSLQDAMPTSSSFAFRCVKAPS